MGGVRFLISALISKQISDSGRRFQLISTDFTTQCTRFLLLPAPRAPPTSSLANSIICACANLCRAKNRSGHGRNGQSGCYGPAIS